MLSLFWAPKKFDRKKDRPKKIGFSEARILN